MKKFVLTWALAQGLLLALTVGVAISRAEPPAPLRTLNSGHHFLPPYSNPRDRFGFDSLVNDPLTNYDVAQLNAGWYTDWCANRTPPHPDGLTYAQLLSLKAGPDPHDPTQVTVSPDRSTIANIAAEHPGSLWMLGNEPDSYFQGTPLYPDVYAHVYYEFYHYIKGLDSTALIANGGIVQPTPCRMEYLDIAWNTYQQAYGEPMPVDVWNIHAFVIYEDDPWSGVKWPPGVDPSCAMDYHIRDGDNVDIFRDNLIAFRQWMKDKGEQNKPLIISEYGVLWPEYYPGTTIPFYDEDGRTFPPARVSHFMIQTFDLFLYETYPDVGYPEDDYRLVQTWAWYSLSDSRYYNGYLFCSSGSSNPTCREIGSKQISPMGQAFANYTAALPDTLYADLTIHSSATLDTSPLQNITLGDPYETTLATLPILAPVTNLGKLPVNDVPIAAYPSSLLTHAITSLARYTADVTPQPVASLVLTQPARYDFDLNFSITVDPDNSVGDPRPWNNSMTTTINVMVDARPDLATVTATWSVRPTETSSNVLSIIPKVANEGIWPAPPVSGTLSLSNAQGSLLLPNRHFSIPALEFGDYAIITEELTLVSPTLYYLVLEADSDDVVDEPDEDNNRVEVTVDARPDLRISIADWSIQPLCAPDSMLNITFTVSNAGVWRARPVSGTRYLSNMQDTLLLPAHHFSIPAIAAGDQVTMMQETTLPAPEEEDFYSLVLEADSDGILDEQDEGNNRAEMMVPVIVTTTLEPDAASALTSTSGHMAFLFPTGTVTTTTEICFVPIWPSELPPGPLLDITAFRLTTCPGEEAISPTLLLPVTVTWRYTDTDVVGLDENQLYLYHWTESSRWQYVYCPAEQHWPDENRLSTCIQQLGDYVFGHTYKLYLPLILASR